MSAAVLKQNKVPFKKTKTCIIAFHNRIRKPEQAFAILKTSRLNNKQLRDMQRTIKRGRAQEGSFFLQKKKL